MDLFDQDTIDSEVERLTLLAGARRVPYSGRLSRSAIGAEALGAPKDDVGLSHDDFVAATRQLAEEHGASFGQVRSMIMDAHQRSGLGYSEAERAQVINQVALSMEQGRLQVSDAQLLELSGASEPDAIGLAGDISKAERREAARRGLALPGGSYPIRNARELHAAAILARSGHGDVAAAKKLIARRAHELGVRNPLEDSGPVAASASTMKLALSMLGADTGELVPLSGPEAEVARLAVEHADVLGLAHPSKVRHAGHEQDPRACPGSRGREPARPSLACLRPRGGGDEAGADIQCRRSASAHIFADYSSKYEREISERIRMRPEILA